MAAERRRFEGSLVAYEIAWVVRCITGQSLDVNAINPYGGGDVQTPARRPKCAGRVEAESQAGWKLLDEFFHSS